jgi:2-C-methyl-D-erythritol 4-phosphate cytidylyltransferase
MRTWFVIPAAGGGRRIGGDRPKQYQGIAGKPLLQHTLDRLDQVPAISGGVIALAEADPYWSEIRPPQTWPLQVCVGGAERNDSVLAALNHLSTSTTSEDWVLVHDAARPLVRVEDIARLRAAVTAQGLGGILALPVADTLKRSANAERIAETVDRSGLWRALTPQMFPLHALREALLQAAAAGVVVTDEAQAMERLGVQPLLVQGAADNLKITHPEDWALAEQILHSQLR